MRSAYAPTPAATARAGRTRGSAIGATSPRSATTVARTTRRASGRLIGSPRTVKPPVATTRTARRRTPAASASSGRARTVTAGGCTWREGCRNAASAGGPAVERVPEEDGQDPEAVDRGGDEPR